LRQFIAPASILVALLASPAGARCIGSTDPVIQRMELETGRNPAAAVALISKEIADTNPANRRRLTELYLAKSQALYMSGASMDPALAKAREIGSGYGPTDNIGMYLRISEAIGKADAAETAKDLQSLAGGLDALPDGSPRQNLPRDRFCLLQFGHRTVARSDGIRSPGLPQLAGSRGFARAGAGSLRARAAGVDGA